MRRVVSLSVIVMMLGACSPAAEPTSIPVPESAAPSERVTEALETDEPTAVTSEPAAQIVRLTEDELNPVHEDTLWILQYGGGGGGTECDDPLTGQAVTVDIPSTYYFPETVRWCVCGISREEPYEASVTLPDGSSKPLTGSVEGYG